jgi:RNA polymerase sigma-70 factor (ECF subfamily)
LPRAGLFPTTHWSLILAGRDDTSSRGELLGKLIETYWRPVYVYMRAKGLAVDDAKDAVQGLFAQLLERDFVRRLDPARGRLRHYLKASADHYVINRHERESAARRGGGLRPVPFDTELIERTWDARHEGPDRAYEREWALGLMERALTRLRAEFESGRRRGDASTLLRFFGFDAPPTYEDAAAACGMTPAQFKSALHRARQRYRELLREEVGATVGAVVVDDELRELRRALGP